MNATPNLVLSTGEYDIVGTRPIRPDGPDKVMGRARYAADIHPAGLLYGKILRPDALNAKMTTVNTDSARAVPGVTVVHEGDFVGVVAPTTQTASRALAAIRAEWQTPPQPSAQAVAAQPSAAPAWPPVAAAAQARPRVQPPSFAMYHSKRRPSFWRRMKNTLLGTPEPVLEDSL